MERGVLTDTVVLQGASRPLAVCLALLLPVASAVAESPGTLAWKLDQSVGVVDSQWREKTPDGVTHVKEGGQLQFAATVLTASHPLVDVTVRHLQLRGHRLYEGVTNQGHSATSMSEVRNGTLGLSVLKRASPSWTFDAAIDRVSMQRDIRSTAMAVGYSERYEYTMGTLGIQHQLGLLSGLDLLTHLSIGRSFDEGLLVSLPGFDPAQMKMGQGRTTGISWQLVKYFSDSKWRASLKLGYVKDEFKSGDAITLFKGGRIAGSAQQPAWHHAATQLSAKVSYDF